jgi:hypothetical protein
MATYDTLSAQQRAIVDLILKRGQSYDQLADTLGMPEARVRELACETLTRLAPVSAAAVDDGWRGQVADYLLDQQTPTEAASTRGHLRRSEAARAWSRSVLDSLEHLYPNGDLPSIPAGDGGGPEPRSAKAAPARGALPPEAAALVRRRRLIGAGAIAVALLLALLVWPVGLVTGGGGDDDGDGGSGGSNGDAAQVENLGAVLLEPPPGASGDATGIAIVTRTDGLLELGVQAQLQPSRRNQAYEAWLFDSPQHAVSLGAQVTDAQGAFAGRAELPGDYEDYRWIHLTRERVDDDASHSGNVVLRARIASIQAPQGGAGGQGGDPDS